MNFRFAVAQDAHHLAPLNAQLIRDEGHRNSMTVEQLEQRMASWLARAEYQAVIFEQAGATTGYALFRRNDDHVYLRQFVVASDFRRRGVGRSALNWFGLTLGRTWTACALTYLSGIEKDRHSGNPSASSRTA
jgi:GNAT superfamily N-acetyltransferase